jgi:hypothetical protein
MGIKLMPKSDVARAKAVAKRQEADEGLKLAKRIDALRETAALEEVSLDEFRKKTLEAIHADTEKERKVLESLKSEVRELESRRKDLQEPLDAEWDSLNQAKETFIEREKELEKRLDIATQDRREAAKYKRDARTALEAIATRETAICVSLKSASDLEKAAKEDRKAAEKVRDDATYLKELVEAELKQRDADCASRERSITMREAILKSREEELDKEWRLLNDRKAMRERLNRKQ